MDLLFLLGICTSPVDEVWNTLTTVLNFGDLKRTLQPIGQAAEFKFESKFDPCLSSGNHSRGLFQKTIEGLEGKINGQAALGAAPQEVQPSWAA